MALDSKAGWRNRAGALAAVLLLAGCAAAPTAAPRPAAAIPIPYGAGGLERVIGQPAAALTALFGQPQADVREGTARKLQFAGPICVLDAYLYPKGRSEKGGGDKGGGDKGGGEPLVTYLDTRELDGGPIDRASCVAALSHRERAR